MSTLKVYDADGFEMVLPTVAAVCSRCDGKGVHVNPAIDGNGLPEDCMDDDEFMEDYMSGVYDVPCHGCSGERVVRVPDFDRFTPVQLAAYQEATRDEAAHRAECEVERLMGC